MPLPAALDALQGVDTLEGREEDPLASGWTLYPEADNTGAIDNDGWHAKKQAAGSVAELLAAMSTTDTMQHAEFPASWVQLPWAGARGSISESGWRPSGWQGETWPADSRSGWYLNSVLLKGGDAAVKMQRATEFGELNLRQFSLWLFMDKTLLEAEKGPVGYQLVAWQTGTEDTYTLKLRRWDWNAETEEAEETLLDEQAGVEFDVLGEFALVCFNGKVSGWRRFNEEAAWELATEEVEDSTHEEGYAGVDGNGSNPTFKNFAADELSTEEEETHAGAYLE